MAFKNRKIVSSSVIPDVILTTFVSVTEKDGHSIVSHSESVSQLDVRVEDFHLGNLLKAGVDVTKVNSAVISNNDNSKIVEELLNNAEKNLNDNNQSE